MKKAKLATNAGKKASSKAEDTAAPSSAVDAIALLKADHRKVEKLFAQFEAEEDDSKKTEIANQICQELIVHAKLEEEIFYPACKEKAVKESNLNEAQVEHDGAKVMISNILSRSPSDPFFDAKVTVLQEYIKHHVAEEEKPRSGIFAQAKKAELDMTELGQRLQTRKSELTNQGEALLGEILEAKSLQFQHIQTDEEINMPRYSNNRDRDDDGRFSSNGGRSQQSRNGGYSSRSGQEDYNDRGRDGGRDRDDRGRFTSDDDDDGRSSRNSGSRSQSSRSDYEDDSDRSRAGYGGRSGSGQRSSGRYQDDDSHERGYSARSNSDDDDDGNRYQDRDDRGRFVSDDDDDDRSGRGRSASSRYGSRQESSGSDRDRDERGRFNSDDNDDGRSGRGSQSGNRARSNQDDDDRAYRSSRSGRQESGDNDGRSSRSSGRGSSQGSSRASSSRGGGSSSRDSEDRGHGGWFGDHRAHSQAAKRGWEHRGE